MGLYGWRGRRRERPDFGEPSWTRKGNRDAGNRRRGRAGAQSGACVEPHNAFGIARNTLAPAPGRFICPWARSTVPG
jgi:hypothetical protein